ncbi:FeoA family protein [Vibrio sp. YMD68]|uniref:FeoA family protein n=1 Tax=Vibrio sp. YMD68 TaxID=3042300 RepID=UPI002499B8B1|nr:FeoA family protein [Vibrio sp. YMD68]WGV98861.1 FeoA family protein [Vibrio sp. YMD68]
MNIQLSELKPGEKGVILSHHAEGVVRQRLLDLGLIPEMELELVRYAPMGDPLEIRVGLTNVVIRVKEAETVIVDCYR